MASIIDLIQAMAAGPNTPGKKQKPAPKKAPAKESLRPDKLTVDPRYMIGDPQGDAEYMPLPTFVNRDIPQGFNGRKYNRFLAQPPGVVNNVQTIAPDQPPVTVPQGWRYGPNASGMNGWSDANGNPGLLPANFQKGQPAQPQWIDAAKKRKQSLRLYTT